MSASANAPSPPDEQASSSSNPVSWLLNGGQMGAAIRSCDWAKTSLGPIDTWPQELRTAVGLCLHTRFPMFLWWGKELINLYNDAYIPTLGKRHPDALGKPARSLWEDVWPAVAPQVNAVLERGEACWQERMRIVTRRNGYNEEAYFTYSYSPVFNEGGHVAGLLCVVSEETGHVQTEVSLRSSEERQAFLLRLSDALRPLADPVTIQFEAARLLGEYLGANRVGYAEARPDGETLVVTRNYVNGVPSLEGRYRWDEYGSELLRELENGRTVVRGSIGSDPTLTDTEKVAHAALQLGATANVPLVKAGHLVAILFLHYRDAHEFKPIELALLEDVAARAWEAVERAWAEEELRRSYEELRRMNRELEGFGYVASHDLQEPLRMVSIYSQLLIERFRTGAPETEKYAQFVQKGVRRMQTLIQDLLTYSRAVQREELPIGCADLSAALSEAVSVLQTRVEENGAVITHDDEFPAVQGDTEQLSHVFQNLISNALKYRSAERAPVIHIYAERAGGQSIIAVRDNGIGFDQQHADHIFGLFKRLHKDEYPGTGLGLAICQRIVERYGGRMWAEGRLGNGATFFFALPAADGD